MRNKIKLATISFILSLILFSCTIEKRTYRKGYYVNWHHSADKTKDNKHLAAAVPPAKINSEKPLHTFSENNLASVAEEKIIDKKTVQRKTIFSADECGDVITLKNGDELKVKVTEINDKEIKYKRCDNLDGPLIVINKSDVFMIKYSNGTKEVFKDTPSKPNNPPKQNGNYNNSNSNGNANKGPEVLPLAVISFVSGLTWIWFLGSITAIITGAIALRKIKAEPEKYKGKELAIAGIVLGALGILLLFLVIYLVIVLGI